MNWRKFFIVTVAGVSAAIVTHVPHVDTTWVIVFLLILIYMNQD